MLSDVPISAVGARTHRKKKYERTRVLPLQRPNSRMPNFLWTAKLESNLQWNRHPPHPALLL